MPKKSKIIFDILKAIAEFTGEMIELMPGIFIRESMYYKNLRIGGHDPEKLERAFRNLRQRRFIQMDKDKFRFTSKGQKWLKNSYRRYFISQKPAADKKWRIVLFDIPREKNKSRDKLRNTLKLWGFYMLQRSVFVSPYACEEELAEVCRKLEISECVDIVLADSPGFRESEIKKFFDMS